MITSLMTPSTRLALLLGLATLAALGLSAAQPAQAQTLLTDTTVGNFTFIVPNGVTTLFVQLYGAGGGGGVGGGSGGNGGNGKVILTNASPVPEVSTIVSFGLLLALGLSGLAVAKRKKVTG